MTNDTVTRRTARLDPKAMHKLRKVMRKTEQKLNTLSRKMDRERKLMREAYEWDSLGY